MSEASVRSSSRRTSQAASQSEASATAPAPAAPHLPGNLKQPRSIEERQRRAATSAAMKASEVPNLTAPAATEESSPNEIALTPAPSPAPSLPPSPAAVSGTLTQLKLFKTPAAELKTLRNDAVKVAQTIAPPADPVQRVNEIILMQNWSASLQKKAASQARSEANKKNEPILADLRCEVNTTLKQVERQHVLLKAQLDQVERLKAQLDLQGRRTNAMKMDYNNALVRDKKVRLIPPQPPP